MLHEDKKVDLDCMTEEETQDLHVQDLNISDLISDEQMIRRLET